jgi:hypothetical protein
VNAFLYLIGRSARNRFLFAFRRARSPRYAAALIVGVLYVWSFLVRPVNQAGATSFLLGQPTEMLVTLLMMLTLMGAWLFGADATALAFTQAEVSMLFSAPVARRSLILYKLYRAQIAVLVNALIWVFVLRRGGSALPAPLRAVGLWVLFSTLNLHRLGAALVRTSWREHGSSGARRHRGSIAFFVIVGALVAGGVFQAREALLAADGASAFFAALGRALAAPPARWGLYPFHLIIAPAFAHSASEWAASIIPAVGVLIVHGWWVLRSDAAFEDAAIEASAERARRLDATRSRRSSVATSAPRAATSTIQLASVGNAGFAILWKNMLCLRRTAQLRVFIGPVAMALALGVAVSGNGADAAEVLATCALALVALLLLFGGRLIRNDLRHDMQHLPLLKTLPIAPGDIVLAEVASAALPMAAAQMLLIIVAYTALLASSIDPLGRDMQLALFVTSPFAILAVNGALLTIQNGIAVLFPAWIRLGPTVSTGVEALGQNVLGMVANLVSLALALVIPAFVALGVAKLLGETRAMTVAVVVILAAVILSVESYGAMRFLGRALAKAEPGQTE